jgi:hypothetical protein
MTIARLSKWREHWCMTGSWSYKAQQHRKALTMGKLTHFMRTGSGSKTSRTRYSKGQPSADAEIAKGEFLARRKATKKRERPKLTPLQRRMTSGGPS